MNRSRNTNRNALRIVGGTFFAWIISTAILYTISFICVTQLSQTLAAKQLPLLGHIIAALFIPIMIPAGVIAWFVSLAHPTALFLN